MVAIEVTLALNMRQNANFAQNKRLTEASLIYAKTVC